MPPSRSVPAQGLLDSSVAPAPGCMGDGEDGEEHRAPLQVPPSALSIFPACSPQGQCTPTAFRQAELLGEECMGWDGLHPAVVKCLCPTHCSHPCAHEIKPSIWVKDVLHCPSPFPFFWQYLGVPLAVINELP